MSKALQIAMALFICSLFIIDAQAQQVVLRTSTLSAGANTSGSSNFVLQSTIGQTVVGASAGTAYQVNAGFWFQARPPAMVAVNQPPSAPQLTEPTDGTDIVIGGNVGEPPVDPTTPFVVAWTAAVDPEESALSYTWQLATENGFTNILLNQQTGSNTRYETKLSEIALALDQAGVSLHTSVLLWHRVLASDGQLTTASTTARITLTRGTLTAAEEDEVDIPTHFALHSNYPNPFNPSTTIAYDLPTSAEVILTVFDVQGREVQRFARGRQPAGHYELQFEAGDLATGVYLYRIVAGPNRAAQTMLLLK